MTPVIISAALVGSQPTKEMNPAVPYSPKEIANSAIEAHAAGAAIVHVHVREPDTGKATSALDLFRETLDRIRAACPVLVNLTTSGYNLARQDTAPPGSVVCARHFLLYVYFQILGENRPQHRIGRGSGAAHAGAV